MVLFNMRIKKDKKKIVIVLMVVLLASLFFTGAWVVLNISGTRSYELKPLELYDSWLLKPNPGWDGCRTAECMGDDNDVTTARLFSGGSVPYQKGSLDYTVPQSSGLYQGTPLTVTVYVRAIDVNAGQETTITPTLNGVHGGTFSVPWDQGFQEFSHEFDVQGWSWADIDDMKIGAYCNPGDSDGLVIDWSEIWAVVEYDDTPPPLPDVGITFTMTVITNPSNCEVFVAGVETLNSDEFGIAVFEDVPYGSHDIFVSKSGYPTATKTVFVDSDAVINIDLSQNFLLFLLILILILVAVVAIIYCYKKGIIRI